MEGKRFFDPLFQAARRDPSNSGSKIRRFTVLPGAQDRFRARFIEAQSHYEQLLAELHAVHHEGA